MPERPGYAACCCGLFSIFYFPLPGIKQGRPTKCSTKGDHGGKEGGGSSGNFWAPRCGRRKSYPFLFDHQPGEKSAIPLAGALSTMGSSRLARGFSSRAVGDPSCRCLWSTSSTPRYFQCLLSRLCSFFLWQAVRSCRMHGGGGGTARPSRATWMKSAHTIIRP